MKLDSTCLKVDRPNAKAMIDGFEKEGKVHRQSIWLAVKDRQFPALLTLQRVPTRFKMSVIGERMDPESFAIPLKYVADLDSEYFVKNTMSLWQILCSNGLFDIWQPDQPYERFAQSRSHPSRFRIQLLRVYEIDNEFAPTDIEYASTRIDKLISPVRHVAVRRPLIADVDFAGVKALLKRSVAEYLISPVRPSKSRILPDNIEIGVSMDVESLEQENEYFEGKRVPRLSSFYERNPRLRTAAVKHHGTVCTVCNFDFSKAYGDRGAGFIEVHHLIPVSCLDESRPVDPVHEMTVLCSNCHRMIHRRRDAVLTPEQLRAIMSRESGS